MGKASLIMVLGMSLVLAVIQFGISRRTTDATLNFIDYYNDAQLFNLKSTGAEMALVYLDRTSLGQFTFLDQDIKIGKDSLFHVKVRVDSINVDTFKVTSIASFINTYQSMTQGATTSDTTRIVLRRASFSRYSYFTNIETTPHGTRIYWFTVDTLKGGCLHTNDALALDGNPLFKGRVTTFKGYTNTVTPLDGRWFQGGYESPIKVDMPLDFSEIKTNMGGGFVQADTDLTVTFYPDGTVNLKTTRINVTKPLTTVAPNGLIIANRANIHVQGTVSGRVTIAALENTSTGVGGNIYIDNDVKLNVMGNDPTQGDLLGMCADNDVIVTDNAANNADGIDIQATIMARTGSFYAEHVYESGYGTNTRVVSGRQNIRLVGGICQQRRGLVSVSGSTFYGYKKSYDYDGRLMRTRPPYFPMMSAFEIVSWWE